MNFVNNTKLEVGWTLGFERDGRELIVVAVKATYLIPGASRPLQLAEEQVKLTQADEFTGEPGRSAPVYETDYAHRKPLCDVLINGSAYAPGGRRQREVPVGVKVGPMVKTFLVIGPRCWVNGVVGVSPSDPEPFDVMQISYDNAFGGVDDTRGERGQVRTFPENPVGRGYFYYTDGAHGKPMPNTEEIGSRTTDPRGRYRPMSFGVIGRNWQPRAQFAGTYDEAWIEQRAPFWPEDFDDRYFQAAPPDQQIPYPKGGEEVVLQNLHPAGRMHFTLPTLGMPVLFIPRRGPDRTAAADIDTVVIEPERNRVMLTWRAGLPLRRNCFEMKEVVVGEMPRAWHLGRKPVRKPHYHGIRELVRARGLQARKGAT